MNISLVKKVLLKSMVPLVRRFQGHHVLLINLHNLPLMDITACTKYIKDKQTDSVFKYTLKSNKLCNTLNVKIVVLTESLEKLIKHLDLDYEQYKKEMAEWLDMMDERQELAVIKIWPMQSADPDSSGEATTQEIKFNKDEYLKRLVNNRLNRMFPYSN